MPWFFSPGSCDRPPVAIRPMRLLRLRRHFADDAPEFEAAPRVRLRRGERVEDDRHHRPVHARREEVQRHHGAVVEFELVAKPGSMPLS